MKILSIAKPSYLLKLKRKQVADFRKVPKKELNHYFEPNHYKTSTIMGKVIPYEYHCSISTKSKSKTGLFPPEILLIYVVENEGRPYPLGWGAKYSDFWWFECGIVDVSSILNKLRDKGYLILENGRYIATNKGKNELEQNEDIIWAYNTCFKAKGLRLRGNIHATTSIGGIWDIKEVGKYNQGKKRS